MTRIGHAPDRRYPLAFTMLAILVTFSLSGCVERFTAHDVDFCEERADGLFVQARGRGGSLDRTDDRWEFSGPLIKGVLECDVEHRPVSDFGFRVYVSEVDAFIFHPDDSSLDAEGKPDHLLVQYLVEDDKRPKQSDHHPADYTSVGLAVGNWASPGEAKTTSGTSGYPSRRAMFDISYESEDADDAVDVFPSASVRLDLWSKSDPSWVVSLSFPVLNDGTIVYPTTSYHRDVPLTTDPLSGLAVPVLDLGDPDGPT